jgi:hypothetical protein
MRLDALLNIDKGLPPWAYIKKSNAANDPPSLVHKQMRSRTLFDGSAPRTAYVLFAPSTLTHIVIQKSQRRSEEHGRLRKEVLGWQTRLGLLLALGFREHEDDECRTTCAFTPFSRDRRLNDLSAVCF